MRVHTLSRARSVLASATLAAFLVVGSAAPVFTQALASEKTYTVKKMKRGFQFVRLHGSSPYVCTPSGFGQKARCYLRSV
jgi:hypothetical protein